MTRIDTSKLKYYAIMNNQAYNLLETPPNFPRSSNFHFFLASNTFPKAVVIPLDTAVVAAIVGAAAVWLAAIVILDNCRV